MNNYTVDIERVTQTTVVNSNKIGIFVTQLTLFKSACISVHFYNEEGGGVFKVENLKMEDDDYAKWSSDDKYIEEFVLQKLNLKHA
jgi:hypothetical protein